MVKNTDAKAELDAIVAEEEATRRVNDEVAVKLAEAFDDSADVFKRGGILSRGVKRGATLAEVAERVTVLRYAKALRITEAEAVDALATPEGAKRAKRLRVNMSKSNAQAYVSAWTAVVDAGLTPTRDTYALMFRAKSTGGTASLIKEAVEASVNAERGEREETLISGLTSGLATLTANAKSKGRPNEGDGSGDVDSDVPVSLDVALATIDGIFAQEWSDDDRAALIAHVLTLAGADVEV